MMSKRPARQIAPRIARALVGAAGIAVAALAILAATFLPIPTVAHTVPTLSVRPVPAAQQLICPGAFLQLGDEQGKNVTAPRGLGTPSTATAALSGTVQRSSLSLEGADGPPVGPPLVLSAEKLAGEAAPATLAGAQSQTLNTGDFRGLAASSCTQASTDAWLVGGATTVGRTTLITVTNPSDVVATVALHIFGEDGAINAPGSAGILVSARSERVFSLAGFAPNVGAPVVHVTSSGGPVAAFLQQTVVRGIESGGVDIVAASASPSTTVTIPGFVVVNSGQVEALVGGDGYGDLGTVLRVFAPGRADGTAQVSMSSESEHVTGASFSVNLSAGTVTDLPVEGLSDGTYSISVKSTVPIVAAVRASTVASNAADGATAGPIDFAWFGSARPLNSSAFVVVAQADGPTLHLSNPSRAATTVVVHPSHGEATTVTVRAGSSASVAVSGGQSYLLDGFGTVFASVSYSGTGRIASIRISPSVGSLGPVTVYP